MTDGPALLRNIVANPDDQRLDVRVYPPDEAADAVLEERFGTTVTLDSSSREF